MHEPELENNKESHELDPIGFWEEKQRELLTSVVDYNLSTLTDLINDRNIDLSPSYQRRNRWDDLKKSALIESFLMNVPVPPIFLNEDNYGEYSVIDGKQRLLSIHEFLTGSLRLRDLTVFSELNDRKVFELPSKLQSVLKTRPTLRAVIILRQSDEDVKFEVFRRLNTGGVKLNAQEVRNSVYPGSLNRLNLELSENKDFHRLLGIKTKSESKFYREMSDVELVLRYFTFRNSWQDFPGGIIRQLDKFMANNRNISVEEVEESREDFLNTLSVVNICFGEHAFRRWNPEKGNWRNQLLASLYDTEMLACKGLVPEKVYPYRDEILNRLQRLFENADFRKAIDASIPFYFKLRVEMLKAEIANVVG